MGDARLTAALLLLLTICTILTDNVAYAYNPINATLTPSPSQSGQQFGWDIALANEGKTAVISAPSRDNLKGAVFVYEYSAVTAWEQLTILAPDASTVHYFGTSVAADGDTIAVGAPYYNSTHGAVFVFVRTGESYALEQAIARPIAGFGVEVSLSGDTIAVGPALNDDDVAAVVFARSGSSWSHQQTLTASVTSEAADDCFITALDGDILAVSFYAAGAIFIFTRSASTWTLTQTLAGPTGVGESLAISRGGDLIAAGYDDYSDQAGAVYVYRRQSGSYALDAKLYASDSTHDYLFGDSVSTDGEFVAVGSRWADAPHLASGAGYLFHRNATTGEWAQQGRFVPGRLGDNSQFGYGVAVQGRTVVGTKWERAVVYNTDTITSFDDRPEPSYMFYVIVGIIVASAAVTAAALLSLAVAAVILYTVLAKSRGRTTLDAQALDAIIFGDDTKVHLLRAFDPSTVHVHRESGFRGEGVHGTVYECRVDDIDDLCAFKEMTLTPEARRTTEGLVGYLEKLSLADVHGVCRVHGVVMSDTTLGVVTDLADRTMLDLLDSGEIPTDWPGRWALSREIAQAVAGLHDHSIIHGNLKETNVQFKDGRVLLTDAGLADFSKTGFLASETPDATRQARDVEDLGQLLGLISGGERGALGPVALPDDIPEGWRVLLEECASDNVWQRPSAADVVARVDQLVSAAEMEGPVDGAEIAYLF
ncbi:Protein kinase domain [Carpediemonas membranifera]|uniref:Protein kinase domain n=1 Tax=Carpediemonas membranifera TaxID=201153 RepID=A0A8J6B5Y1_9EUKA|nr:Protein kinase domain [Carpediemonas membranifera]|eukprot:KAG9394954.1 Protein kinase domain [Carpediemonas membranifera]